MSFQFADDLRKLQNQLFQLKSTSQPCSKYINQLADDQMISAYYNA